VAEREDTEDSGERSISYNKQLRPVLEIVDAILAGDTEAAMAELPPEVQADMDALPPEDDMAAEEAPMPDEAAPEETPEAVDLAPLEAVVGAENAAAIWNASGQRADLADLTPQELADRLEEDFQLRMELEKLAAQAEGGEEMPMEEMPPDMMAAGPDMGMGAPAGGPPMGPGGPGGMLPGGY